MNPLIQLRGAFYLVLPLAVGAIPFALAQRNATSQSGANLNQGGFTLSDIGVVSNNSGIQAATRYTGGGINNNGGGTPLATPCASVWVEATPVPYGAGGIFAASDGTYVYAGGGADFPTATIHNDLWKYNPRNDSWTQLQSSPDEYFQSPAVYFNGKIYNTGGFTEFPGVATDVTRIYDIATNTWDNTTGAHLPVPLGAMATMLWNGIIYVAGGAFNTTWVDTLYAYDIASNTWTTLAPLPQALDNPGFGAIDGQLYIAGGWNGMTTFDTLYIYDITSNSWSTGPPMPQAVTKPGSAVFDDGTGPKLYVYGGRLPDSTLTNITQIYDLSSNTWSSGPNMNVALFSTYGTAVDNDTIVSLGGFDANFDGLNDNEQLNPPCATPTPTPTPASTPRPLPTPRPRPTPAPRP